MRRSIVPSSRISAIVFLVRLSPAAAQSVIAANSDGSPGLSYDSLGRCSQ
jgi:hypothetical protein